MVYQFACYKIFPTLKKLIIYLPKHVGGLGVSDIIVQQHILQQRYVRALLLDNQVSRPITAFLLQLLSRFIQVAYWASHPHLPLLLRNMRYGSPLIGQHCLLPLFRSVDAFYVEASWDNCSLSPDTLLQMPLFLELWHQATTDTSFLDHKLIHMKPAHTFLENSRLHDSLVFKARASCPNSGLLIKIIAAVRSSTINFVPSLPCVYLSAPLGPDSLSVTDGGSDLSLYFRHKLLYQGTVL